MLLLFLVSFISVRSVFLGSWIGFAKRLWLPKSQACFLAISEARPLQHNPNHQANVLLSQFLMKYGKSWLILFLIGCIKFSLPNSLLAAKNGT